jgi:hypothetical protein
MSEFTLACAVVVGLIVAYALGYRNGIAYCLREMEPLRKHLEDLRAMTGRR